MPPRSKKEQKDKEPKNQGGGGGAMRERTDDELKNSPTFNKIFVSEVLKQSKDPNEKAFIEQAFRESTDHDDFNMKCFDIEWFLERYEELFNQAKQEAMKPQPKKEEPPVMKQEPYYPQQEDPNRYMMNPNLNVKFEPAYGSYGEPYQHPGMPQHSTGPIFNSMNPQMNPQMPPQMPQMASQMGTQMKSAYPNPAEQYPPPYNYQPQPQVQPQNQRMSHMNQYGQPSQQPYIAQAQPTQPPPQQQQPLMPVQSQQMPAHIPTQPQTPQTPIQQTGRVPMEKEEPALIKHQLQTEFETNMQLRQKLSSIVPLNSVNMLNFLAHKVNKKATDGFYNGLYLAVADYAKNLLDELRIICEMDNDAGDMSTYQKSTTTGANQSNGTMEIESSKTVLMGSDGTTEPKPPKSGQYLIRFSSLQEDQKQIEKLDDREQKDLEERYTMSKDDDEEKITKKVKKDFTEEDEIIKFLFKTNKDKNQDNESYNKRIKETNMFLDRVTSRSYAMTTAASAGDQGAQKQPGKGRKGGGGQKRVSMKHLIYYLETNPLYKRTPLLHKAYLK